MSNKKNLIEGSLSENYIMDIEILRESKKSCKENFPAICAGTNRWLQEQGFNITLEEIREIVREVFGLEPVVMWGRQLPTVRAESWVFHFVGEMVNKCVFDGQGIVGCVPLFGDVMCVNNQDKVTLCSLPIFIGDTAHKYKIAPIQANKSLISHKYKLTKQQEDYFEKHFGLKMENEGTIVSFHNSLVISAGMQVLPDMEEVHKKIINILKKRESLPEKLWLDDEKAPRQIFSVNIDSAQQMEKCRLTAADAYKLIFYMLSLLPDVIYMVRDGLPKYDSKFTGGAFDDLLSKTGLEVFPFCDLGPFGEDKDVLVYPSKSTTEQIRIMPDWGRNLSWISKRLMGEIRAKSIEVHNEEKQQKYNMKQKAIKV